MNSGVGLAVYNRLIRAAAFRKVPLEPKVIGLTGPTGSGKSTICKRLKELGCGIVDCDLIAREAVLDIDVLRALSDTFGDGILLENGTLNRRELAARAFADQKQTARLNAIMHPWIVNRMKTEVDRMKKEPLSAVVLDASQLFEAHAEVLCDAVWVVTAPAEERLRRICLRDNIDEAAARRRMNAQLSDEFFAAHADCLIVNTDAAIACCEAETHLLSLLPCEEAVL